MNSPTGTGMTRRQFLLWSAVVVSGCQTANNTTTSSNVSGHEQVIDAGPAASYAANGVYTRFRDQGFFLVRADGKLFALSSMCTHKKCKLTAEPDHSFYCKCHGSTFDPTGKVTEGPARRDLPVLSTIMDEKGELLVKVPAG